MHNNVEQITPFNNGSLEGMVLLHDSDPVVLANLQRMCIERTCSDSKMIRSLPSLYAVEALVDQSPGSFELVLMDLTEDSDGGLLLAQKLRAHGVHVIVTASRQAFSPTRFVNLLQARATPRPTRSSSGLPSGWALLPSFQQRASERLQGGDVPLSPYVACHSARVWVCPTGADAG